MSEPAEAPPLTAKQRHWARVQAFVQADEQQRQAERQERARRLGASEPMTADELQLLQHARDCELRESMAASLASIAADLRAIRAAVIPADEAAEDSRPRRAAFIPDDRDWHPARL